MLTTETVQIRDPLLLAYEERQRRLKLDRKTIVQFRQVARRFQSYMDDIGATAGDMEPWQLEEYLLGLELAPSTVEAHLKKLRAAYRYAMLRGVREDDPTRDVRLPRNPTKEPRIIPADTLREMRERAWDERLWLMFHLLAYTGMRRCEIIMLRWEHVSLEETSLLVHGKMDKNRYVPIHPALGEALAGSSRREGAVIRPARGKQIGQDTWDELLRQLTLGEYTAHDFRRTVATSLVRNGVEERIVDRIMGWAPRSVRGRYYINVASEELQRAILRLYADNPV